MTATIKTVELPGGVKLPFVERGDPSGIPVLLLHGYTDSWRSFEPVLPHLPESMRVFALTQRGHGDADRPMAGYGLHELAADVAAFMDCLELGPAVIAGHSMGSYVAQRFAMDYPGRTRGLVLIGSFTNVRDNAGASELREAVSALADPVDPGFVREFQESTLARPVPRAFLETVVQESLKLPARVWRAALEGWAEADISGELGRIKAPTLIVWGDRDAFFPRSEQEALAAAIAHARLVIYPGAGHALHWEEPDRFAAELAAFAASLAGRRE